jgi:nucleoside-diphosphate-sugar epimerase
MLTSHPVTGAAGFIGYHVAERLLARGETVVGLDNLNDYYDPRLKPAAPAGQSALHASSGSNWPTARRWRRCSRGTASRASCTWRRRPACATR